MTCGHDKLSDDDIDDLSDLEFVEPEEPRWGLPIRRQGRGGGIAAMTVDRFDVPAALTDEAIRRLMLLHCAYDCDEHEALFYFMRRGTTPRNAGPNDIVGIVSLADECLRIETNLAAQTKQLRALITQTLSGVARFRDRRRENPFDGSVIAD